LIKTFPYYVYDNKGIFLKNSGIGLNQFGVYLQKFQIKTEKRKENLKKIEKGPGAKL
jgi:hypothetical protein